MADVQKFIKDLFAANNITVSKSQAAFLDDFIKGNKTPWQ
jgi:hypothetical protein